MNNPANTDKKTILFLLALALGVQLIVYAPHVGKGFVTDDFEWLGSIVANGKVDYLRPFTMTTGFFRPLVGLSFGLQYQLHGMNPLPYGWFNLGLHLANILLVYLLLSAWSPTKRCALAAAILFSLNAKSASMAVGWISGRTSLLFGFFMLLSLYLLLNSSQKETIPKRILCCFPAGLAYFAALLSKETAAAAPVFIFFFTFFIQNQRARNAAAGTPATLKKIKTAALAALVYIITLLVYFSLRRLSNAYSPFNAADFYRYTFSPVGILKNLSEHFIRGGLLDIYLLIILAILFLIIKKRTASTPSITVHIDKTVLWPGAAWFLIFLLPVLLLPARSDLYAYIPQVGLHVMFLVMLFPLWQNSTSEIKKPLYVFIPIVLILAAWTGYLFTRAGGYGQAGNASAEFTRQVLPTVSKLETGGRVFIIDTGSTQRFSPSKTVSYGFGSLLNLYYPGKQFTGEIITPDHIEKLRTEGGSIHVFTWNNGKLEGPFAGANFN